MGDRITLMEAFSALAGYGAAFWCGVAAAIATFIIEIILVKKGYSLPGRTKNLLWQSNGATC